MTAADQRCPICEWPYARTLDEGCIPGNCSMRPAPLRMPTVDKDAPSFLARRVTEQNVELATLRAKLAACEKDLDVARAELSVVEPQGRWLKKSVELAAKLAEAEAPVPIVLVCPLCETQHIDEGEWATTRHHKTHQCVDGPFGPGCGYQWRPCNRATVGVRYEDIAALAASAKGEK